MEGQIRELIKSTADLLNAIWRVANCSCCVDIIQLVLDAPIPSDLKVYLSRTMYNEPRPHQLSKLEVIVRLLLKISESDMLFLTQVNGVYVIPEDAGVLIIVWVLFLVSLAIRATLAGINPDQVQVLSTETEITVLMDQLGSSRPPLVGTSSIEEFSIGSQYNENTFLILKEVFPDLQRAGEGFEINLRYFDGVQSRLYSTQTVDEGLRGVTNLDYTNFLQINTGNQDQFLAGFLLILALTDLTVH